MAPGNCETKERKLWYFLIRGVPDEMREDMCLKMINVEQGDPQGKGEGLGKRGANQKGSQKSRPTGISDGIQLIFPYICFGQGDLYHRDDVLLMGPRGQLRDYAPEVPVNFLVGDHVGKDVVAPDHRSGGIIAGRLYTKD